MKDLAGRVALITGAGSGIGRGTAMALGARGVRIIAADIDEAGPGQTVMEILAAATWAWTGHWTWPATWRSSGSGGWTS